MEATVDVLQGSHIWLQADDPELIAMTNSLDAEEGTFVHFLQQAIK